MASSSSSSSSCIRCGTTTTTTTTTAATTTTTTTSYGSCGYYGLWLLRLLLLLILVVVCGCGCCRRVMRVLAAWPNMNMAPWNYATKFMLRQAELLICQIFIGLEGLAHEQLLVYFPNAFSIVQRIFLSRCMVQPREAVDTGLVAAACTWTAGSDQMAEKA